jgi:hypothetical protein
MTTLCEMLCLGDPRDDTGDRLIWLVLAGHVPARTSFLDAGVFRGRDSCSARTRCTRQDDDFGQPGALWEKVVDETGTGAVGAGSPPFAAGRVTPCPAGYSPGYVPQ